jgi:hypothetical protein
MFKALFPLLPFALAVLAPVVAALAPEPEPVLHPVDPGFLHALEARPVVGAWLGTAYG